MDCELAKAPFEGALQPGNPYNTALLLCGFVVLSTFFISTLSKNYSQVDKLWSIVPACYAWIPVCDGRTVLMAIVATIWGLRLTWNFNRRGGYAWPPWSGDEDYRWAEIQKGNFVKILTNPFVWSVFNFGFISLYQNILLLLIVAPSFVAFDVATTCNASPPIGVFDYLATVLVLGFIFIESVADNQQFAFQTEKYRLRNAGERLRGEYADGFNQSGLFAVVRKPNYAAEQSIWISYYVFSIAATKSLWNWSAIGFIMLSILFQTSGWFTEKLTRAKYPTYNDYMRSVPLYVPMPWRTTKTKTS